MNEMTGFLNISPSKLSNWLNGINYTTHHELRRISEILKCESLPSLILESLLGEFQGAGVLGHDAD